MKNSIRVNFFERLHAQGYNLFVEKNGFNVDCSQRDTSQGFKDPTKNTPDKKSKIPSFLMLVLLCLFTNFLFAQQPACNIKGTLETKLQKDGGQVFTINSEVVKTLPGTIYQWEFKSNDSDASFASPNGLPTISIKPGDKNGNFNLKLTVINPATTRGAGKSCSCTKSVSIGSL